MPREEEATLEEVLENLSEATRLLRATPNPLALPVCPKISTKDLNHRLLSALATVESS